MLLSFTIIFLLGCKSENEKLGINHQGNSNLSNKLDEYFQTLKTLEKFNGVVLVEKEGKQVLFKAYILDNKPFAFGAEYDGNLNILSMIEEIENKIII